MTQKLIYSALVMALMVGVYYGQITPQSEPPEITESIEIDQSTPLETRSSKSASSDKIDTYSETVSKAEIPVVKDASNLRSLNLGDQFRLSGVTDNESLDIDVTVTQLDKNDLLTLMHGSIASGGSAIITLGGQSVNNFIKTDAGIFEFGGDNFDGNVAQLGDIEWGDDIYKETLPKPLPPNEPSLGVRLVEP